MAINLNLVKNWTFPIIRQTYSEKDTILYALALGYGGQPTNADELAFVYERHLQAVPTMSTTLCHPGFWISDSKTGIDASRAVHGEQKVVFHSPLPAKGTVRGQARVVDVIDKGKGKGALLIVARTLHNDDSGTLLASLEQRIMCRGDGGFAEQPATTSEPVGQSKQPLVNAKPDHVVSTPTLPQAALIYRLCADMNPLHADPLIALSAGFERPILHGLCTYGVAARAIIQACCANDPTALKQFSARFSAPVFPGETLQTDIWQESGGVRFRCLIPERNVVVISNGFAEITAASH